MPLSDLQDEKIATPALELRQARDAYTRNDFDEAARLCRAVLARRSDHPDAQLLLGMVAVKTRQLELALEMLPRAVLAAPRNAQAHTQLAAALLLLNRNDEALASTTRALKLKRDDALTLNIRACVLGNLNRHHQSLQACDRALKIQPDYAEALVNRGNALVQLQRPQDALKSFNRARRLRPDFVAAINNCANVLKQLGRFGEALLRYDQALALAPAFAEAVFNRGVTLGELGRPREALACYQRALEINPDHLDARCNLAHCRLQLGDFRRGWDDYEAQRQKSLQMRKRAPIAQPLWLGKVPLNGKTILLHAEAGLGDTLQFCRYARHVAARGAHVLLQVQRPLLKVLSQLEGAHTLIAKDARLPRFDYHCPLMSLPGAFKTDLHTIPAQVPYVHSDAVRAARWHSRLGRKIATRVGLVWSGHPAHSNDHNRSLPLQALLPLLGDSAEWVSLHNEVRAADVETLAREPRIRHFGAQLKDFADTAALIEHMDLVIAVDTSVAHLAGAMGKPLWLLLPFNPDWRWLLKRKDSPWYPTARLFRQPAIGDWASVIAAVRTALARRRVSQALPVRGAW